MKVELDCLRLKIEIVSLQSSPVISKGDIDDITSLGSEAADSVYSVG